MASKVMVGRAALLEEVRSSVKSSPAPALILLVYRTKQTSIAVSLLALPGERLIQSMSTI